MRINNELKYLTMLLFLTAALLLFLSKGKIGLSILFFFFLSSPVYYYHSFRKLLKTSLLLKEKHNNFYKKNLSNRRYGSLWLITVPIFGFLAKIKSLKDDEVLESARSLKRSSNYSFCCFIITVVAMLVFTMVQ